MESLGLIRKLTQCVLYPPRMVLLRQIFFSRQKIWFVFFRYFFYVLILAPSSIFLSYQDKWNTIVGKYIR